MTETIRLEGFDELEKALGNANELFKPLASKAMSISLQAIKAEIAPYPPQPDRMRSGSLNTYVRGQGRYPKSAFIPDSGEPGGFRTKKGSQAVKLTSQQMNKKFRRKVKVRKAWVEGELRNDATYSGYVIGPESGDPHQVDFHAQTGWTNADDAIEQARPIIDNSIDFAVNALIEKLAGGN